MLMRLNKQQTLFWIIAPPQNLTAHTHARAHSGDNVWDFYTHLLYERCM